MELFIDAILAYSSWDNLDELRFLIQKAMRLSLDIDPSLEAAFIHKKALKSYEERIEEEFCNEILYLEKGLSLASIGRIQETRDTFKLLRESCLYNVSLHYLEWNDFKNFETAISHIENSPSEGLKYLESSINSMPYFAYLELKGHCYANLGRNEEAIKSLKSAIILAKKNNRLSYADKVLISVIVEGMTR